MFVKLTLADTTGIHVRADQISAVYRLTSMETTRVAIVGKDFWEVRETPEQVLMLIRQVQMGGLGY